jgi:predicted CxxxxCH...CXXCH cytochrome family protein
MQAHEAGIAAIAAGTAQRVTFGTLADTGAAVAAWDRTTQKCSNLYCHGATINHGGTNHEPAWTLQDPTHLQTSCGSCHGFPPPTPHPANNACSSCHSASVDAGWGIVITGGVSTHLDGLLTIDSAACAGEGCTCCHGAPPATGAHLAHVSTTATTYGVDSKTSDTLTVTATTYDFGCGNCHPTDGTQHTGGAVDLSPTSGTVGSLKAHNSGTATYDSMTNTCDGVYCHSSGQASPTFKPTPGWFSGASLGCDGCHGNPPAYANGGSGTATANSHVGTLVFGSQVATGHFMGLPAALHQGSAHGGGIGTQFAGDSAAPITCQTCHFNTADPTSTGASGFYYLDTSGDYASAGATITVTCNGCHTGAPAAGTGKVKPYVHVNGTRDVDFDRRLDFSTATGTPALPATDPPTRPYWYTRATTGNTSGTQTELVSQVAAGAVPGIGFDGTTPSLDLRAATWNAATKSCSSVACHLNRLQATSPAVQWGEPLSSSGTCSVCHDKL